MISIDPRSAVPIPVQITNAFRDLIKKELLKPGDPVPAIRTLARKLVVAPDTVQNAYREATSQGLFEKTKSGYCISARAPQITERVPEPLLNLAKSIQLAREEGFNWEAIQNVINNLRNPALVVPAGAVCPYCRQLMEQNEVIVICFACKTVHHEECWGEVLRCSVFGCASSVRLSP